MTDELTLPTAEAPTAPVDQAGTPTFSDAVDPALQDSIERAKSEGLSAGQYFLGEHRSKTTVGARAEQSDFQAAAGIVAHDPVFSPGGDTTPEDFGIEPVFLPVKAAQFEQRKQQALDQVYAQQAYEASPPNRTLATMAAGAAGAFADPINFTGFGSWLTSQWPKGFQAGKLATTALDAGLSNVVSDIATQMTRTQSGAQEHFDPEQAIAAFPMGLTAGTILHGAVHGAAVAAHAIVNRILGFPEPKTATPDGLRASPEAEGASAAPLQPTEQTPAVAAPIEPEVRERAVETILAGPVPVTRPDAEALVDGVATEDAVTAFREAWLRAVAEAPPAETQAVGATPEAASGALNEAAAVPATAASPGAVTPPAAEGSAKPDKAGAEPSAVPDLSKIVNPIDPAAPPEEKLRQLQALTEENRPFVKDFIRRIDEEFGTKSGDNVKAPEKILEKAARPSILAKKPWHGVEHIRDSYRFKTVLDDVRDLDKIVQRLDEAGIEVVKRDTDKVLRPGEWGWRIASFDLRMPNGQLVEYYLPVKELEAAKKSKGHHLFEIWRNENTDNLTPQQRTQMAADMQASRDLYQQAWDDYLGRTSAPLSEVRASLARASASPAERSVKSSSSSPTVTPGLARQVSPDLSAVKPSVQSQTNSIDGSSLDRNALSTAHTSISEVGQDALAVKRAHVAELEQAYEQARSRSDAAYWAFTRQAKGQPVPHEMTVGEVKAKAAFYQARRELHAMETGAPVPIGAPVPRIEPHKVAAADGTSIEVVPVIVEARDLVTSSDGGYTSELQPRNRDRAASQAQIRDIAANLDPERLGYSAEADRGAPIVGPDKLVESGNGRVLAIRRAYEQGGEAADKYRRWVNKQSDGAASGFEQPVLVRQRVSELSAEQRQHFTVAANQAATLAMSATERAAADARLLSPEVLALIHNANDLGSSVNRDAIRAFVGKLPQTEQGAIITGDGGLSSEGLTRFRNAVLARAYGDEKILGRIAEATDDDAKSLSNALVSAAPDWAMLRSDVSAGTVRADVDLTRELMEAVKRTTDLRAKNMKLATWLAQQDAFDRVTEPVETFMRMFYDPRGSRAAGSPRIATSLQVYAREARKASAEAGLDLGLPPVSAKDIQALAASKGAAGGQAEQTVFFRRGSRDGANDEARRRNLPGSRPDEGGAGPRGPGDTGDLGQSGDAGQRRQAESADETLLRGKQSPTPESIVDGRPVEDQGTTGGRLQRLEDLAAQLAKDFQTITRVDRLVPGALGQFSTRSGVIRIRSTRDVKTLTHEIAHDLHQDPRFKAAIDGILRTHAQELSKLGVNPAEEFAELFSMFATRRGYAANTFPGATADLHALLSGVSLPKKPSMVDKVRGKTQPTLLQVLDKLQQDLDATHNARSGELVTADTIVSDPPGFADKLKEYVASDVAPNGDTVYAAADALYTSTVDKLHPIYRAVQSLAKIATANGKPVTVRPADDAYVLARMAPGAHGVAGTQLRHGVIPAGEVNPVGPSLFDAITTALGKKWDATQFREFGAYLVARRMVVEYDRFLRDEIPNPPGKHSLADYKHAIAEFEAKNPNVQAGAVQVYQFLTNHLQRQFDKGLVSKAYYDAAMSRADHVPFVRDMRDLVDNEFVGAGRPRSLLRNSIMKAFRGSDRSVQNPLESIFKRVHDIEFVIGRNDTINALDDLAQQAGTGAGLIAERVPNSQLTSQRTDALEVLKAAGNKGVIAGNIDKLDLEQLLLQAEDILDGSTMATLFRNTPIQHEGGEPIVYGWRNGERYALRLADGRFGKELFHALTVMSEPERYWFAQVLQISQAMLRWGVTKAPDFLLANFVRDQFTATATGGRRYIPFISALRGLNDIFRFGRPQTDAALQYAATGAQSAGAIVEALNHAGFGQNVHALQGGNVLGKLAKVFEASEGGTRLGLFRSYKQQAEKLGFDEYNAVLYAAFKAQDYMDFRRSGASMDQLRRWVPFLGAALQGTDKEIRALTDWPRLMLKDARGEVLTPQEVEALKDGRIAWVRVLAMGAVLGTGLAVINADKPEYQTASNYVKDNYFLFKVGNTWISIPKPFGTIQAVVNLFERGAAYAIRRDPSQLSHWAGASALGMLPPYTNPALGLAFDLPANYDRFRDRQIVPDYMRKLDASEQYTMATSGLAKAVGQVTGWSPMKIDYAVRNMGASFALDLLKTGDALMGGEGAAKQVYDWPVAHRFVRNLERASEAQGAFNELVGQTVGRLEQAANAYRFKIDQGQKQDAGRYLANLPEDERVWTLMQKYGDGRAGEKRMHPLLNAREQVNVIHGLQRQLNAGNVIKKEDIDNSDATRSKRDAQPIILDAETRAKLIEETQSLNNAIVRNAMIAVGAKGSTGLPVLDTKDLEQRLRWLSPALADEYQARIKNTLDPEKVRELWPQVKARVLQDGDLFDVTDLAKQAKRPKPPKVAKNQE